MKRYFHRTGARAARAILRSGFRDATHYYLTLTPHTGVWLSDVPLNVNDGVNGDALLVVEIDGRKVSKFEWVEEAKPYREFLVPAKVLNTYGSVRRARPAEDP